MWRCDQCPDLPIPKQFLDKSEDAKWLNFAEYKRHGFCTEHKSIQGCPKECPTCKEIDEKKCKKVMSSLQRGSTSRAGH